MLERNFRETNRQQLLWQKNDKLLLAISGGVDSIVLLDLFLTLPKDQRPQVGVAHIDHQLRVESAQEADFLRDYCKKQDIPYYEAKWQAAQKQTGNLEGAAREFRYRFFQEICDNENYQGVVTGHHSDDQAETVLMKLTSGGQLHHLGGMARVSHREGLTIFRPLLDYSKKELRDYSARRHLTFFEDQTNQRTDYFRNRMRNQIIPQLKIENPNFLKQIHSFVKQIEYASDIVEDTVNKLYPNIVTKVKRNRWQIEVAAVQKLSTSLQYMFFVQFFQKTLINQGIKVHDSQLQAVLALVNSSNSRGTVSLAGKWQITKSYDLLSLSQMSPAKLTEEPQKLKIGESLSLSETEKLFYVTEDQVVEIPEFCEAWTSYELILPSCQNYQELSIRKPQAGDRLIINQEGSRKKVSRYFIDSKIPHEIRQKTWLVLNSKGEIIWIMPFRKSYLSIEKETDKIHYRLIYLKNEQDLEGDSYVGEGY